jgi:hypothetical protein
MLQHADTPEYVKKISNRKTRVQKKSIGTINKKRKIKQMNN